MSKTERAAEAVRSILRHHVDPRAVKLPRRVSKLIAATCAPLLPPGSYAVKIDTGRLRASVPVVGAR